MKGLKLNIKSISLITKACIIIGLSLGILTSILGIYESWSQQDLTDFSTVLKATLWCISVGFILASFWHADKELVLTKFFKKGIEWRLEHSLRFTGFMFAGVLIFGVNSEVKWVSDLHYIFTGAGIVSGYIGLLFWSKTKRQRLWSYIAVAIGIGGFVLGFIFKYYSTSWAEVIAAFPLAFWLYKSLNR